VPEHVAQQIGAALLRLRASGIDAAARTMEAVLQDVNLGITDNLLLKTSLTPAAVDELLRTEIGRLQKYWSLRWLS
jgi:hypothetical protein